MLFPVGEKVGQEGVRETVADTGGTTATARFERHCLNSSNKNARGFRVGLSFTD
jgi:hypothetical protein